MATYPVHRAATLPSSISTMCFIRITTLLTRDRVGVIQNQALQALLREHMSSDNSTTKIRAVSTERSDCAMRAATELICGMRGTEDSRLFFFGGLPCIYATETNSRFVVLREGSGGLEAVRAVPSMWKADKKASFSCNLTISFVFLYMRLVRTLYGEGSNLAT